MALYEYRCGGCSESFDLMRSMSEADDPASCPTCGSESASRMMTTFVAMGSSNPASNTNPMMDARMSRGAVGGGCGSGCGCH